MSVIRLRAEADLWEELQSATDGQAAEVTRELWAWYLRRPGAKPPKRPPRAETPETGGQSHA